jgi:hypothetical protein
MRLLDFLRSVRPTHAVIGTYAFDPGFYEAYVLRHLRAQGCASQLLLIDHDCLAGTLEECGFPPTLMGTHYLAQGIRASGAFHPKFLLLLSRESGELILGSNNLTVPGYTHNDELLVHLHYQPDDAAYLGLFQQCWRYIQSCLALQPSSEVVLNHCQQIGEECPWLLAESAPPEDSWLLGRPGGGGSIADQLVNVLGGDAIRRVTIMAPYFDPDLSALTRLAKAFSDADVRVLVQPARCTVNPRRVPALPKNARFFDLADIGRGEPGARFFHAKCILLESRTRSYCLMGSANISIAALYAPHNQGNAELCLLSRHDDPKHFQSVLDINGKLDKLTPINMAAVKTAYSVPPDTPPLDPPPLQPTAAEHDGKQIRVFCGPHAAGIAWDTVQLRLLKTTAPVRQSIAGELRFSVPEGSMSDGSTIGRLTCRWKGKDWCSTPFVIHNIAVLQRNVQAGRLGKLAGYMRRGTFLSGDLSAMASLMAEMLSSFPQGPQSPSSRQRRRQSRHRGNRRSQELSPSASRMRSSSRAVSISRRGSRKQATPRTTTWMRTCDSSHRRLNGLREMRTSLPPSRSWMSKKKTRARIRKTRARRRNNRPRLFAPPKQPNFRSASLACLNGTARNSTSETGSRNPSPCGTWASSSSSARQRCFSAAKNCRQASSRKTARSVISWNGTRFAKASKTSCTAGFCPTVAGLSTG